MIRKWMTVLLSLLLALMLPLCALAQTQHTLTIVPGDLLASEPAVKDLLDVLSLTVAGGQKSGALTLTLDGTDIATIALGADVTGLYAHSTLLGDDVLYVTWDDAFELLKDQMRREMYDENVNSSGISSIMDQFDAFKEQLVLALGGGLVVEPVVQSKEDALAQAAEMFKDDPEMLAYVQGVYEKMTTENGSFADEQRDTADQKYALIMTEEDILPVFDTSYMYRMVWESLERQDPDLGGDNFAEMTQQILDEARKVIADSDIRVAMDVYTLDAGETLVGMDMTMDMTMTVEEDSETINAKFDYDRLTSQEGVNHKAEMLMGAAGADVMKVLFDFNRGNDAVSEGLLGFIVDGEELLVTYHGENPEADVRDREIALYMRSGAVNVIEPAASDRPLIALKLVSRPADPGLLGPIENADPSNSVNVLKLSDEEMQGLVSEISGRAMQAMYTALAKLPTSVMQLLMPQQ